MAPELRQEQTLNQSLIIGQSQQAQAIRDFVELAAMSDYPVILHGEPGTGKDVAAQEIHKRSGRRDHRFIRVNCANLSENLFESELFGHVRGAFTGAVVDKIGQFEAAHRGTIFLNDFDCTPPLAQGKLLAVTEGKSFFALGGTREIQVDVRIITASNADLDAAVVAGKIRTDLLSRLNVLTCTMPLLRDRKEDIPILAEHFLARERSRRPLSTQALAMMVEYEWPENVRELENALKRGVALSAKDGEIKPEHLGLKGYKKPDVVTSKQVSMPEAEAALGQMLNNGASFWDVVYRPFMLRDLRRSDVMFIVDVGLKRTYGNYRRVLQLFNMPESDYKKFLNFLRKHQCQLPQQLYRKM